VGDERQPRDLRLHRIEIGTVGDSKHAGAVGPSIGRRQDAFCPQLEGGVGETLRASASV